MNRPRKLLQLCCIVLTVSTVWAGQPLMVAGVSVFDPAVKGSPLIWAQGQVTYYTDQGDLSPALPQAAADAMVADAFAHWTSIPTVALTVASGGQLGEDVNGTNITSVDGSISLPLDIQPGASVMPVAIVYDSDGAVTDAFLGIGASSDCVENAVFGGPDNFSIDAHLVHALIVINGLCAPTANQIPDIEYRLIRIIGQTLGLGWSQANPNVLTGIPPATSADRAGFPVLHQKDPGPCVAIATCLADAAQPKMDDRASLGQLYPVTVDNQAAFPNGTLFAETTGRIHGVVRFSSNSSGPGQPMQGVNVVARLMNLSLGEASRTTVAACVSGFLFRGNAGNPITGTLDALGEPYDRFGSDDTALEGYFDLAGLEIPAGQDTAIYQLSIEALDETWANLVGPYGSSQVAPSGTFLPVQIELSAGSNATQDIVMTGTPPDTADFLEPQSFDTPAHVPSTGEWLASFSGYGDLDYYQFTGQTDRTLSVEVTALDEQGHPVVDKAEPVIGIWSLAAPDGTPPPAFTPGPFSSSNVGMSQLNAQLLATTDFRIGVADLRGDGRPDFRYQMRVFYGDTIAPARVSVAGGTPVFATGLGFRLNTTVAVGGILGTTLSADTNQVLAAPPAFPDGVVDVTLSDPATGASSMLTSALTYGAGATDTLRLLTGGNPGVPIGGETTTPLLFQVEAVDGTPVAGATVKFSSATGGVLTACAGIAVCSVLSDDSGKVSTNVDVQAVGAITITAQLAPASYANPSTAQATVVGTTSTLDITLLGQRQWMLQSANDTIVFTARVLSNGVAVKARTVNFQMVAGTATLSAANAVTDTNGFSTVTATITQLTSAGLQVNACAMPGSVPCQRFTITAVPLASLRLESVAGSRQAAIIGTPVQVTVRVTDSSVPANPVRAATLTLASATVRTPQVQVRDAGGGEIITRPGTPVIKNLPAKNKTSDEEGLARFTVDFPGASPGDDLEGTITLGGASWTFDFPVVATVTVPGSRAVPGESSTDVPSPERKQLDDPRAGREAKASGARMRK